MSKHIRNYDQDQDDEERRAIAARECERLRAQHDLLQYAADGKLLWVPQPQLDAGLKVLDSAGADGTWCHALHAQISSNDRKEGEPWFLTTDLDAFKFPVGDHAADASELKGSGFEFLVHDLTDPWPSHLHDRFDLVHQRLAIAASAKTPTVTTLQRFGALLKPNTGYLQLVELDTSPQQGRHSAMEEYIALLDAVTVATGVRQYFATGLRGDFNKAGFVDVGEEILRVPVGCGLEKKELREQSVLNLVGFCERFVELGRRFEVSVDEGLTRRLEAMLRSEGSWLVFRVVYGRKP